MTRPAPCDEPRDGGDASAAPGRSSAGAVDAVEAPEMAVLRAENEILKACLSKAEEYAVGWEDLHREARTALADNERKRVELIKGLRIIATFIDPIEVRRRLHALIALTTASTTQETPNVEG